MEQTLINNWNSRVTKNDEVYILGDMFWYNEEAPRILSELKGRKYLILGNHDRVNAEMAKHFVWCDKRLEGIKDEGQKVVLCHFDSVLQRVWASLSLNHYLGIVLQFQGKTKEQKEHN